MAEKNSSLVTCILFSFVGLIYFATAAYSFWFSKDYNQVDINISLGIMFILIGVSFLTKNNEK
jgi:hypothetical protein